MAQPQVKKTAWRSTPLKLVSLMLGYTFWYIFSHAHNTTLWIQVPLCFYNLPDHTSIQAPEQVSIKVQGKRSLLRAMDFDQLAIHVNASKLKQGKNVLAFNQESLFLPESINLLHYSPSNPIVELIPEDFLSEGITQKYHL